ncbi:MAG: MarR family transcriptional regulator [Actinobacteria bacterium]|uniref:Unannotated protein n=1 Tax=freshwater metagenome TaxID=449393 RepID=A0A6J7FDW0_9ZZZZ|nr:MarR family transcriptional regulator [Actinomycetota bacterium]
MAQRVDARFVASPLAEETAFLLARARALGITLANRRFAEVGLKARSYAVLSLAASDMQPNQRELAEFLSLDASQIVAIVDTLERAELVERKPDPSDRRSNVIVATPEGKRVYATAHKAASEAESETLTALSENERVELRRLLAKIAL